MLRGTIEVDGFGYEIADGRIPVVTSTGPTGEERDVKRRIAVLGPMRELGIHSDSLHAGLAPAIVAAHVDRLILIGEEMRPLAEQVVGKVSLDLVDSVDDAIAGLLAKLHAGDAVLVKASNSVGLAKLVERVAGGAA